MSDFEVAIGRVLAHEGGYINDPMDRGGETNWGVTRNTATAAGYTGKMRDMTRDQAKAIYKLLYWDGIKANQMPFAVAYQVFDAAVNHGVSAASKMIQRAVGVADDGVIGTNTLRAINSRSAQNLVLEFNGARISFYTAIAKPQFDRFGRGWMNRVAQNLRYAAND
jgi:lysozyme family protein